MTFLSRWPLLPLFTALSLLASGCEAPLSASGSARPNQSEQVYYRPSEQLGELFEAVQLAPVFEDSKTFVDSRPGRAPGEVLALYTISRQKPEFDLHQFVHEQFVLPQPVGDTFRHRVPLPMEAHLRRHWEYLTRPADSDDPFSSLIPLPFPYVVPGGRFREIYYWDSYFTMLGLVESDRFDLVESMLDNFAWLIDNLGHIPNGNRTYYLSRSQPPFFASMVALLGDHRGDAAIARYLPQLEKEHAFWMAGAEDLKPGEAHRRAARMPDGSLLNRYYDDLAEPRPESYREDVATAEVLPQAQRPELYRNLRAAAESGWDFSSRWLAEPSDLSSAQTVDIIPVDLNSLLYQLETVISRLHKQAGNQPQAEAFATRAEARKDAIHQWLWDERQQLFGDYHFDQRRLTGVASLATVYPLFFGLASSDQAAAIAQQLQTRFLKPGGLVSTLVDTGQQWDYPNGWAPLQWLAIKGLRDYGHQKLSQEVAGRWLALNRKVYQNTGRMMEKYNVIATDLAAGGGEYPLQDGFGWTNGVALAIIAGQDKSVSSAPVRSEYSHRENAPPSGR